jgi:hypothetical protein
MPEFSGRFRAHFCAAAGAPYPAARPEELLALALSLPAGPIICHAADEAVLLAGLAPGPVVVLPRGGPQRGSLWTPA